VLKQVIEFRFSA